MRLILALSALSLIASPLAAAPCRNAHGKFIKCVAAAKKAPCRDTKGHFIKCK